MKEKIESISKLLPIIYPIILFLGFYNYVAYYRYFDIEIFNYLSIYELLFSFISLVIPIFITVFIFFFYFLYAIVLPNSFNKEKDEKDKKSELDNIDADYGKYSALHRLVKIKGTKDPKFSLIFNNSHKAIFYSLKFFILKFTNKCYSRALSHLGKFSYKLFSFTLKIGIWFLFICFTLAIFIIMVYPTNLEINYFKPFFTSSTSTIVSILIWAFILYVIIFRAGKNKKRSAVIFIRTIPIILLIFFTITIFQKIEAEKTLAHKNRDVSFIYDGERIESNPQRLFIGKTSDYIFLRDVKNKRNYIYLMHDIKNLEMSIIKK